MLHFLLSPLGVGGVFLWKRNILDIFLELNASLQSETVSMKASENNDLVLYCPLAHHRVWMMSICSLAAYLLARQVGVSDLVHGHQGRKQGQQGHNPPCCPLHCALEPV